MHTSTLSGDLRVLLRSGGLAIIVAILFVLSGCDVFSSSEDTYTVSGTIVNSTDRGVENASVAFSQDGSTAKTTTTDDAGNYEVSGLSEGSYEVSVSADGYNETTFTVSSVNSNTTVPEQDLLGPATVRGTVTDAVTNETLSDAEVAFTFGGQDADTSRSTADLIASVNSEGQYTIVDAPTGRFICVIRSPGYIPAIVPEIEVSDGENDLGQASTSETLEEGQVRIVLEWGEEPSDLDSHLTGPDQDGGRFHVYYANQNPGDGANLDRDDVTSYGPETVTINEFRTGTYRYSVFNFSNQSEDGALGINQSPARVTVYDSDGQRGTYSPPLANAGDGNTWRILEIEGGSMSFDDNGGSTFGYYTAAGSSDMTTFNMNKPSHPTPKQKRTLESVFDRSPDSF